MKWNYEQCSCDISTPGYIERALTRFQHPAPTEQQDSPHKHDIPQYGAKVQFTNDPDNSPPTWRHRYQIRTGSPWNPPVLCSRNRSHHSSSHQNNCNTTIQANMTDNAGHHPAPELLCDTSKRNCEIQSKWYGLTHQKWYFLPVGTKRTITLRPFFISAIS